tara:strand:+ start:906 stop:1787 length:882 start_codon:yes stop_codon:yes gene_type:complete
MARIVDKDTRLIDIDFGPLSTGLTRTASEIAPSAVTYGENGKLQAIRLEPLSAATPPSNDTFPGSFIQYQMIDLSYMTKNNEVMQPTEISVQRYSPVPFGYNYNGNTWEPIEEYIYIFTRPLNHNRLETGPSSSIFEDMRALGLDRSETISTNLGGDDTGIPSHEQTVYAEKRMYSYTNQLMATTTNGALIPGNPSYESIANMPVLDSVTTWGTMGAITGPNLHCYRVVINKTQQMLFPDTIVTNTAFQGLGVQTWPAVNITFLCKDPKYSEGEYLTRLANAMNNIPIDGETA